MREKKKKSSESCLQVTDAFIVVPNQTIWLGLISLLHLCAGVPMKLL